MVTGGPTMPATYVNPDNIAVTDILVRLNQTFNLQLAFTDSSNAPINFTGATFLMQIRSNSNSTGTLLLELSSENSMISYGDDATLGLVTLSIDVTTVETITWTRGFYDLKMTIAGVDTVLMQGFIDTYPGISTVGS